jgi:osmotically-inducible protein OsmY
LLNRFRFPEFRNVGLSAGLAAAAGKVSELRLCKKVNKSELHFADAPINERSTAMADDRWREDERRRWEEDRARYGGSYGQGRPRPYYERPESQAEYDRLGYGQGRYGEGGLGQSFGGAWTSGDIDRPRGRGGESWRGYGEGEGWRGGYGAGEGWAGGAYEGGYRGTGSPAGYGREGWRGYGEGWAGGRQEGTHGRGREQDRSWWDRATDEVSSWMGDEDAERRRRMDQARGGHYGKGPRGYTRSDDRIREDVNDRLTDDWQLDASEVEVVVGNCEVTLNGTVTSRDDKRRAEDLAENVSGVRHVQNNLRVQPTSGTAGSFASAQSTTGEATRRAGSTASTGTASGGSSRSTR